MTFLNPKHYFWVLLLSVLEATVCTSGINFFYPNLGIWELVATMLLGVFLLRNILFLRLLNWVGKQATQAAIRVIDAHFPGEGVTIP